MSPKPLILLVDDDVSTHELIHDVLDHLDMDFRVAWDEKSTMKVLAECKPDAILLDIFLPDTDGYTLLEEIHALPALANCPVVATTAYYTTDSTSAMLERGFNALLLKPYDPQQIIKVLAMVIPPK